MRPSNSIKQLTQKYFREWIDFQPLNGLSLGLKGGEGRYSDYSESRIQSFLKFLSELHRDLKRIDIKKLPPAQWIESQLLLSEILLKQKEWGEWREHQSDPTRFVGELVYGLWYLFLRVESPARRVEAALERLNDSGIVLENARRVLKRPPKVWTQIAIGQAQAYLVFLDEVLAELLRLRPRRRFEIEAAIAKARAVGRELVKFLKGDLTRRSTGKFASGKAAFEFRLKHYHHYDLSAAELLKVGKQAFQNVKAELVAQAKRIDPKTPWHRLSDKIKKQHPSRARLLEAYRRETAALKKRVKALKLVSIPKGETLQIIPTPVFSRHTIPYAAYVDPPMFGGKNRGTFFVTPITTTNPKEAKEVLGEHNLPSIRVTALHEGYPGHHLQFAVQKGAAGILMKMFNCSSFYEGWALYCEELMAEQNYYDDATRFIQIKDKLWRACRILVDVGLHTGAMSDVEAVRLMSKELKMSPASARADVNWYTLSPTVPQSYFTGMLRIKALRERCRKAWGTRFSLRRFHDEFLQYGAVPILLVEKALLNSSSQKM